jgi:D-alanyl-D-alanine carboxypeptidase/D-alanyl-D-alanine-endopeptidase (penicillin-binding protein 4)
MIAMRTRMGLVLLAALSLLLACHAGPAKAQAVEASVRQVINAANLGATKVGIYAVDLTNNRELISINPDALLIPASNMKLLTSAASTKVLGPDFIFRTQLTAINKADWTADFQQLESVAAAPSDGIVLLVRADGDPAFADPKLLAEHGIDVEKLLDAWVQVVIKAGIGTVDRLVIDDRIFDTEFVHESWPTDQLNRWYCAQVAGLNFYDNCVDVFTAPAADGSIPRIEMVPDVPFMNTTNKAKSGKLDTFWISRKLGTNEITFRGEVKTARTAPVNITVHDPSLFFGEVLKHRLTRAGVKVGDVMRPERTDRFPGGRTLLVNETTLPAVLERCNRDSMNLFAEALLKRMGHKVTGQPGSWQNGIAAMRLYLQQTIGPRASNIQIADGSGMSRDNKVTARVLVDVLKAMNDDVKTRDLFRKSLSIGGETGTLRNRLENLKHATVFGKSGYIREVSTLSGYLVFDEANGSRVIAFSILCNDFKPPVYLHHARALQEDIVNLLYEAHIAKK